MRIMAAAALWVVLVVVSLAAAPPDTWERKRSEEEKLRIFTEWNAKHSMTDGSLAQEEEDNYDDNEGPYARFKHHLHLIDHRLHSIEAATPSSHGRRGGGDATNLRGLEGTTWEILQLCRPTRKLYRRSYLPECFLPLMCALRFVLNLYSIFHLVYTYHPELYQ
jgi:hypothetical protein